MESPCPRFNPHCSPKPELPDGASWDYSITSPIPYDGQLCKSSTPWPKPVASWTAGQSVTVKLEAGGATHGGGHCQFSLSYDGGKTFVVLHQILGKCFGQDDSQRDFTFTLPSGLPSSDKAVFAWTWVNAIGNREFYMNCADVSVKGSGSSYTGKEMVIANHQGYPDIPEFNGNYQTGAALYKNAKDITVTGNGSTDSAAGNGQQRDNTATVPASPSDTAVYTAVSTQDGAAAGSSDTASQAAPYTMDSIEPYSSGASQAESSADGSDETGTQAASYTMDSIEPSTSAASQAESPAGSSDGTDTQAASYTMESIEPYTSAASQAESSADGSNDTAEDTADDSDMPSATSSSPASSAPQSMYSTFDQASDAPQPTGSSGGADASGGSCPSGQTVRCSSSGTGFQQCVNGQWSAERPCAPGTKCLGSQGTAYCGWS
ncbi:hypothetical protein EV183_001392 [Coemansia sp. RSA 2336]|nr:hypothetical protein EV183_001392 [Coemansia sp. RSA 2336]